MLIAVLSSEGMLGNTQDAFQLICSERDCTLSQEEEAFWKNVCIHNFKQETVLRNEGIRKQYDTHGSGRVTVTAFEGEG